MAGDKLKIAKRAAAQFVRTLAPEDRVGVVAYDHDVDVVSPLSPPNEETARRIERIVHRGNTSLYEGWVAGARLVGRGGRVILL